MMRRERIEKTPSKESRAHLEVLPLDPRDPDILRAKELIRKQRPPRLRAA
jgi:hypothetical protein